MGPGPLHLLLQWLWLTGIIFHAFPPHPMVLKSTALPLLGLDTAVPQIHFRSVSASYQQRLQAMGKTPAPAAPAIFHHRPPLLCFGHWAWTTLSFHHNGCNNVNWSHCENTMLPECKPRSKLNCNVATVTSDHTAWQAMTISTWTSWW